MKIAVLYICTGKYHVFFEDFYKSSEEYFLPPHEKTYFVFSDNMDFAKHDKVAFHYKDCEGFPNDSLYRFKTFLTVENELQCFDYVFFFNSNMKFVATVDETILPSEADGNLCCLDGDYDNVYPHPSFYPYERNKKSKAYIPRGLKEYRYYHAGVNGGRVKEYMDMCRYLKKSIDDDNANGILALFHDESHINKYFTLYRCKRLHSEYGAAEGTPGEKHAKLIITDKTKYSGYFSKGRKTTFPSKVLKTYKMIVRIIKWYI